jgi:hypothetical protein
MPESVRQAWSQRQLLLPFPGQRGLAAALATPPSTRVLDEFGPGSEHCALSQTVKAVALWW